MKKLLTMLFAAVMMFNLVACSATTDQPADNGATPTTENEVDPAETTTADETGTETGDDADTTADAAGETYKIGIIMYQWTDAQGANIQKFCDYLQANMNVEFVYESTFYDDNAQVACVENLISAQCDAIISGYDTNLIAALDTATAAGVYYAVALDHITDEDFAGNAPSEFFVGGTQQFGGDLAALGEDYADAVLATDIDNIGGVSFPDWAFTDAPEIYTAFQSKLTAEGKTVSDLAFSSGFTPEEVQATTQSALNDNADMQALFGMSSGLDYIYPVLQSTEVKLISMGYDDSVSSLIDNGALIAAGNNNHTQSIASCVARIFNAIEGNQYPDAAEGQYNRGSIVNGVAGYPVMGNADQLSDYQTYIIGDPAQGSVTVDELKNSIISYNGAATLAELNTLTNRSIDDVKAAR
ncbi:MAG: hypothetical protein LBV33_00095 [Lachnospiraceae bacterium]|jgi:ABC-type sugar transport system substrate-binding protein|nr:hypothetical protein [Lachnospiraceae bacterium]